MGRRSGFLFTGTILLVFMIISLNPLLEIPLSYSISPTFLSPRCLLLSLMPHLCVMYH